MLRAAKATTTAKRTLRVAAGLVAFIGAGCASMPHTSGRRVAESAVARVRTCVTTRVEALSILGPPTNTRRSGALEILSYEYVNYDSTYAPNWALQLTIDGEGLVSDLEEIRTSDYVPWAHCRSP